MKLSFTSNRQGHFNDPRAWPRAHTDEPLEDYDICSSKNAVLLKNKNYTNFFLSTWRRNAASSLDNRFRNIHV